MKFVVIVNIFLMALVSLDSYKQFRRNNKKKGYYCRV